MPETTEIEIKLPKLRPRLRKFAELILEGETQAKAYKKAGYKAKNDDFAATEANRLLNTTDIKKYVEIRQDQIAKQLQNQTEASVIRTVQELVCLAHIDPKQMYDENGNLKAINDMPEATRRAIASIEETITRSGTSTKIKLWNKNDALKTLAGHLGMLNERKDLGVGLTIEVLYHKEGEEGKTPVKVETTEK
jgi:phage terminase small subunit